MDRCCCHIIRASVWNPYSSLSFLSSRYQQPVTLHKVCRWPSIIRRYNSSCVDAYHEWINERDQNIELIAMKCVILLPSINSSINEWHGDTCKAQRHLDIKTWLVWHATLPDIMWSVITWDCLKNSFVHQLGCLKLFRVAWQHWESMTSDNKRTSCK